MLLQWSYCVTAVNAALLDLPFSTEVDTSLCLQDLLADSNPMVVANAVAALAEIQEVSGKDVFQITSQSLFKLLRALNECTEWGQVMTISSIAKAIITPQMSLTGKFLFSHATSHHHLGVTISAQSHCCPKTTRHAATHCPDDRCSFWTALPHTSHAMERMQKVLWKGSLLGCSMQTALLSCQLSR